MTDFIERVLDRKEIKRTKAKLNPSRRGHYLEALFNRSLRYASDEGQIMPRFFDKFRKLEVEKRDLLGDYWFITRQGKFTLVELKMVNSGTRMSFDRIAPHQLENLRQADVFGFGMLIVHFKGRNKRYGLFAITGNALYSYIKSRDQYVKFLEKQGTKIKKHSKSICLKDLYNIANNKTGLTDEVFILDIVKKKVSWSYKQQEIIDLKELLKCRA